MKNNKRNNKNNKNNNRKKNIANNNNNINVRQLEDQIIGEIFTVVDDIFQSIDSNIRNDENTSDSVNPYINNYSDSNESLFNSQLSNNPESLNNLDSSNNDHNTSNVTLDINRDLRETLTPTIPLNETLPQDENVNLTGGSQLYPGSRITQDTHLARINNHERQLNRRIRQQRYQTLVNNRLNQNNRFNPLLTTQLSRQNRSNRRVTQTPQILRNTPSMRLPNRSNPPPSNVTSGRLPSMSSMTQSSFNSGSSGASRVQPDIARAA